MPYGCTCRGFGHDPRCPADHDTADHDTARAAVFRAAHPGPVRIEKDIDQMSTDELRTELRAARIELKKAPR